MIIVEIDKVKYKIYFKHKHYYEAKISFLDNKGIFESNAEFVVNKKEHFTRGFKKYSATFCIVENLLTTQRVIVGETYVHPDDKFVKKIGVKQSLEKAIEKLNEKLGKDVSEVILNTWSKRK